jgi:hypothetical protein
VSDLGAGPDTWGGARAAFPARAEPYRQSFGITGSQVLAAGVSAIEATPQAKIDAEAVGGDTRFT